MNEPIVMVYAVDCRENPPPPCGALVTFGAGLRARVLDVRVISSAEWRAGLVVPTHRIAYEVISEETEDETTTSTAPRRSCRRDDTHCKRGRNRRRRRISALARGYILLRRLAPPAVGMLLPVAFWASVLVSFLYFVHR